MAFTLAGGGGGRVYSTSRPWVPPDTLPPGCSTPLPPKWHGTRDTLPYPLQPCGWSLRLVTGRTSIFFYGSIVSLLQGKQWQQLNSWWRPWPWPCLWFLCVLMCFTYKCRWHWLSQINMPRALSAYTNVSMYIVGVHTAQTHRHRKVQVDANICTRDPPETTLPNCWTQYDNISSKSLCETSTDFIKE